MINGEVTREIEICRECNGHGVFRVPVTVKHVGPVSVPFYYCTNEDAVMKRCTDCNGSGRWITFKGSITHCVPYVEGMPNMKAVMVPE